MKSPLEFLPGMAPTKDDLICPGGCPARQFERGAYGTTLIGFSGGPEEDPNHWTLIFKCRDCGKTFVKEWIIRSAEVCYTDLDRRVLMGKPLHCCTIKYQTRCDCGGWRKHFGSLWMTYGRREDGSFGPLEPQRRRCDGCGAETEFGD